MSVTERDPEPIAAMPRPIGAPELLLPREVPLGGPRAMLVKRTLPQRSRSSIGAWCFIDHYGPSDVRTRGMAVPGHPHTGLATVTWLFEGEIEHRDTTGTRMLVRPGEVNLMTAGRGIAHSEYSTDTTERVHGAQLWFALPDGEGPGELDGGRGFVHHAPPVVEVDGAHARVFVGDWLGRSGAPAGPLGLFGAEVRIPAATTWRAGLDPAAETGVLVDRGSVTVDGLTVGRSQLVALPAGRPDLVIAAGPEDVRVLVLGGRPFPAPLVMWWNFVGRDHDDIVEARADWQAQVAAHRTAGTADGRFGPHPEAWDDVLPAPELPTVRLRPRTRS